MALQWGVGTLLSLLIEKFYMGRFEERVQVIRRGILMLGYIVYHKLTHTGHYLTKVK